MGFQKLLLLLCTAKSPRDVFFAPYLGTIMVLYKKDPITTII